MDKDIEIPAVPADDTFTGEGKAKQPRYVGKVCENLYNMVEARARAGDFVLTIGGDHSVAAGSIAGTFIIYTKYIRAQKYIRALKTCKYIFIRKHKITTSLSQVS